MRGRLVDPRGEPVAGVAVDLLLDPTLPAPAGEQARIQTTSDAAGRFELRAPPVDGRYSLVAGGGSWQHTVRAYSFVGRDAAERELLLELEPGCELELEVLHPERGAAGDGTYELEGAPRSWFDFGLGRPGLRRQGSFQRGLLRLDALPPMEAQLLVRFDSGEKLELRLALDAGRTRRTVRL